MSFNRTSWLAGSEDPWPLDPGPASARHLPANLLDRWTRALADWNAPTPVSEALGALADPATMVVVTGQQPGFWGGPLFSMYKAATAVTLAARISREQGRRAVAVFWVQGEDTDWDEVGWGALPGQDLSLTRHRWTQSPLPARSWVGSAVVEPPPDMREPFHQWGREHSSLDLPAGDRTDLSAHFIGALLALFGARGLIPLDGRWDETRLAGGDLWTRYHARHRDIARAVQVRGLEVVPPGAPPPLDEETSDHGLFVLEGESRGEVDPGSWDSAVGALLNPGGFSRLAPSVLLRAVLQDHLFGTAFHVVGKVEGSYLRQLEPVYRELGVSEPVRIPRLHATAVPGGVLPGGEVRAALQDPEAWLAGAAAARVDASARKVLSDLDQEVAGRLQKVVEASSGGGKDLEQLAASAGRKIQAQLGRVEEALLRREKQRLYQEDPRLRHLPEFLRPRRGPQERGLSAAAAEFFFGDATAEVMLQAAGDHLDRLREGNLHHFVLESPRE